MALCALNEIKFPPNELISIPKEAENKYAGVSCGNLDRSCTVTNKTRPGAVKDKPCSCITRYYEPDDSKPVTSAIVSIDENDKILTITESLLRLPLTGSSPPFITTLSRMQTGTGGNRCRLQN